MRRASTSVAGLAPARLAELSQVNRWIGPLHVLLEWSLIVGGVTLAQRWDHPAGVVLAAFWVGARQHALLALAHEAAHGRLMRPMIPSMLPSRVRATLIEFLNEALTAWPLLASVRGYRRVHLAHHRHLATPEDPDWARNRPDLWGKPAPLVERLRHLMGLQSNQRSLLAMFVSGGSSRRSTELRWKIARATFYGAGAWIITQLDAWPAVALYWFLPLLCWTTVLMRLRGISEHWAIRPGGSETRTLLLSPLGRLLFLPKNMGYHHEHHLYPGVSFHRLPELHRELHALPGHAECAHTTRGVLALLAEVASFRRSAPSPRAGA